MQPEPPTCHVYVTESRELVFVGYARSPCGGATSTRCRRHAVSFKSGAAKSRATTLAPKCESKQRHLRGRRALSSARRAHTMRSSLGAHRPPVSPLSTLKSQGTERRAGGDKGVPRVKHSVGATVRPAPPRGKQLKRLLTAPHERNTAVHTCYAVEVLAHYNAAAGEIIAPMVARRTFVVDDLAEWDSTCGRPAPAAAAAASLSTPLLEPLFDAVLRGVERCVQIERDHPIIRHRH
eukprot:scaffold112500_cov63-Phaeocystis_antarctica.AAC.3